MSPITIISFISLIPLILSNGDPYPDAVVSLWRLDREGREAKDLLYVGALVTSNLICVPTTFLEELKPLDTLGFYTGRSYRVSRSFEDSVIVQDIKIPSYRTFIFLLVRPGIELSTPYEATSLNLCSKNEYTGDFIGWNVQNGSIKYPVSFRDSNGIYLNTKDKMIISNNFPLGSFIVIGKDIIAFSSQLRSKVYKFLKVTETASKAIKVALQKVGKEIQETENKIDTEAFLSLTDTMVEELIPLVGDRCKFCNKYKQHVLQLPEMSEPTIIDGKADGKSVQGTKTPVDNFQDANGETCSPNNLTVPLDEVTELGVVKPNLANSQDDSRNILKAKNIYI